MMNHLMKSQMYVSREDRSQGEYLNAVEHKFHVECFLQAYLHDNETSKMHQRKAYHVIVLLADVGIVLIDVQCGDNVNTKKEPPRSPISMIVESHPRTNQYGPESHHGIPFQSGSKPPVYLGPPRIEDLHKRICR